MTEPQLQARANGRGAVFWTGLVVGAGVVTYGVIGAWTDREDTHPVELAGWLAASGVVHDLVFAPVVVCAVLATGLLPVWSRTPVRLALALTTLMVMLTWPVVRGWGRDSSDPSLLPLPYGRNLAVVIALTWAVAAAVAIIGRKRSHRDR